MEVSCSAVRIGCGCLLHQLLVPTLQGAVARAHDDYRSMAVCEHLGFHVARLVEVALHEALASAERGDRFAGGSVERFGDQIGIAHNS